jgi:fructokinase
MAVTPHPAPFGAVHGLHKDVLLFGELLVDCFADREVIGGAPFNVARHLRGLGRYAGFDPMLVSRIGKDERGVRMLKKMQAADLAIDGIQQDLLRPTGEVRVTLDDASHTHRFDILPDQAWDFVHADMARLIGLLRRPQWLYFGTLAQRGGSKTALRTLLQTTHAQAFLDLNLRDPWVRKDVLHWSLGKAEIVKLNADELDRISDLLDLPGPTPRARGERLIGKYDLRQLLVTEGAEGAWLLDADNHFFHTQTPTQTQKPEIEVVDSVGAGDAFAAVFLLGLLLAWPIQLRLQRAHRFAGEICRLRGAVPDNDDFYRPFIAEWQLDGEKVG